MRQTALSQRTRLIILLVEIAIVCLASLIVFGRLLPPNGDKGFWFYTGLLGLVLASRLDTPFFAAPADVILYSAPAAVAPALAKNWAPWDPGRRVAFVHRCRLVHLASNQASKAARPCAAASPRRRSRPAGIAGRSAGVCAYCGLIATA